jgi:hypothetical protein
MPITANINTDALNQQISACLAGFCIVCPRMKGVRSLAFPSHKLARGVARIERACNRQSIVAAPAVTRHPISSVVD